MLAKTADLFLVFLSSCSRGCPGLLHLLGPLPHSTPPLRGLLRVQVGLCERVRLPADQREAVLHHGVLLLLLVHRQPHSVQRHVRQVQVGLLIFEEQSCCL